MWVYFLNRFFKLYTATVLPYIAFQLLWGKWRPSMLNKWRRIRFLSSILLKASGVGNCGHLIKVDRFLIVRLSHVLINIYFVDTIRKRFWMIDTPWIQLVLPCRIYKNKSRIKKKFMFLPWIIGEGEKTWVKRFKVNKYVIDDKPSQ